MLGADLYAQSVLSNKISASELSREFIKSALLVGQVSDQKMVNKLMLPPPKHSHELLQEHLYQSNFTYH